ncbi:hypothetical protein CAOG_009714 [Capsaspora owczarzaki ATCC 30864]|uniref:Uncharacterized protein n=1 Tax=Capsaspora owczarzaki (strain ATCC 30864) TaxID=595528 RepID=A0A0D2UD01_CAPO3|nr:hypothetical protein CAOG_009714 [Capsaspora owczarzaki ATCC 30864]
MENDVKNQVLKISALFPLPTSLVLVSDSFMQRTCLRTLAFRLLTHSLARVADHPALRRFAQIFRSFFRITPHFSRPSPLPQWRPLPAPSAFRPTTCRCNPSALLPLGGGDAGG